MTATAAKTATFDTRPLTGALGCEIAGVDLARVDDAMFDAIYRAWLEHSVLVFHDQRLAQEDLAALGRRFGELEDEPFLPNKAEVPGVYYLKGAPRKSGTLSTQNLGWHADHTYQKNPSKGAILYAVDVPAAGGDTLFASSHLAFAGLSPAMQEFLRGKVAIHDVLQYGLNSGHHSVGTTKSIEMLLKMRERHPPMEHPLVCTHPETGREMLFLNQAWTVAIKGLTKDESDAVLGMLKAHSVKNVYTCRVRYRNGTLVIWDNRAVQHSPNSDYDTQRTMWRVALHSDWVPGT